MASAVSRPIANLERYFLGLGNARMFYNVAIGTRLRFQPSNGPKELPRDKDQWLALLVPALATVLQRHPLMNTYIADHLASTPTFQAMSSIDLSKIVAVDSIQQPEDIAKLLQVEHDKPFDLANHAVPLWRIMVVQVVGDGTFYLLYFYHHSLSDGRSSAVFTEQLIDALNHPNNTVPELVASNNPWTITCPTAPLPLPMEQRVEGTPSLKTLVRHFLNLFILPARLKMALETPYWAGEFPSTLTGPNKTQIGVVVLTPEETDQVIAAAKREKTTVNSVLFTSLLFAIKSVFHSGRHNDNDKEELPTTTKDLFKASTMVCPRQLFSPVVERSEHVLFIAELVSQGHCVKLETPFWDFTRAYHAQVIEVQTPEACRKLLEFYGTLDYMSKTPQGYERALHRRYVRQQHGREGTVRTSNIGVGWRGQEREDLPFKVLHPVFSQSAVTTGPVFTFCIATGGGSLVVSNAWEREAFQSRERADRVLEEFRRIVVEACQEDQERYLFRDVVVSA
ncbi:MAG: alcohol acetyltransferase [Podila humilis]|nr:MAG: alcohol acetyltransferase [Podila humilis]